MSNLKLLIGNSFKIFDRETRCKCSTWKTCACIILNYNLEEWSVEFSKSGNSLVPAFVATETNSVLIKFGKILSKLSDYKLLKKDCDS
jgi:hypothetical protein